MDFSTFFSHPLLQVSIPALIAAGATWLHRNQRIKSLEAELDQRLDDLRNSKVRISDLEQAGRIGANGLQAAHANKSAIVSTLNDILEEARAQRATIYIPAKDETDCFLGLLVLGTAPNDISSKNFLGTVFSGRDSKAVQCFFEREPITASSTSFSFDNFEPTSIYSDCLFEKTTGGDAQPVAVVQILSEDKGGIDGALAHQAIQNHSGRLLQHSACFRDGLTTNLEHVDLVVPKRSRRGVVLAFDISNSSRLFTDEARADVTITTMRKVIDLTFNTISQQGGTVESYTGDGFIAAFRSSSAEAGSEVVQRAVSSAFDLIASFDTAMKDVRPELGRDFGAIHPRIGLSTGIVHPISFASGQLREASIIGRTASTASIVCDCAGHDAPSIAIDSATWLELGLEKQAEFGELETDSYSEKARSRGIAVYEWNGSN